MGPTRWVATLCGLAAVAEGLAGGVRAAGPRAHATKAQARSANTAQLAEPEVGKKEVRLKLDPAAVDSVVAALVDEQCDVPDDASEVPVECVDEAELRSVRRRLKKLISASFGGRPLGGAPAVEEEEEEGSSASLGDSLEAGWEQQGKRSSLVRNVVIWKSLAKAVFKVLKARTGTPAEKTAAATFGRDQLLKLGPTFVKLGQVLSTRTDVLPKEYVDVLKSLQDDVPAFSGARAREIVQRELGLKDLGEVFSAFDERPLAAASLGQVHVATLKASGKKVAVKVQRAGLKELFDVDLKNLRKLCELLDYLDPKSDGADRSYIDVFDESEKLLYEEIDYLNEGKNADRFRTDFRNIPGVRVPEVYYDFSTPRVLTMEFVDSFKLTDVARIDREGLDRAALAKKTADTFLYQIVETGYFHCDPHPGNLCVDAAGNLVFYDFGMMDELAPNVRAGFQEFCFALFEGGPLISDLDLSRRAKQLVDAVETAGVLAKGADRLACEKLSRYFIRNFKDTQLGKVKKGGGIKSKLGADLQKLTEDQVFRFPSTFTFIFRAIASIDGIGKGLDPEYDLGKFAQPFVEKLLDRAKYGGDGFAKTLAIAGQATGLNAADVNTAVTLPRKIAYLEETVRAIEQGTLKIRVRSLENESALQRLSTQATATTNLLVASVILNAATALKLARAPALVLTLAAAACAFKGVKALTLDLAAFDKKAAKYTSKDFN